MADRAGESVTANYGWVKPDPGASDDVWGGQVNTDLDAIDAKMFEIDGRPSSSGEITAASTPTSGFEAGQILMSDGATVQAMTYGATMNFGSAAAPLMVSSEAGTPGLLTFTAQQSGYPTAFGIGMRLPGAFTGAGSFGFHLSYGGYFGLNNLSNWMNGLPDFAMVSDANEAGRGDFRSISDPSQPLDLRVYNTYTSYVVGEWGGFDWKTVPNTLTIGTNAAGGGVLRPVNIVGSTVTVNGSAIPAPSSTTPAMDGTAAPGVATTFARGDHVHPKDTSKLPLTGGTLSGNLIIGDGSGSAYLGFNTASGANYSAFSGQVLGTNRWNINLTGVPTETGSGNAGSDFNIIPYTDGGAQLTPALSIKRSTGLATVVADPIAPLGIATKQYVDAHGGGATISDTAPASPAVGALWWNSSATGSGGGQLYTWFNDGNSSQWVPTSNAAASLLPASTTVLGGVKVDGTTIQAAADGTISTTVVPMGDNRIINGDMRLDQRNNGGTGTANGYTVDRWQFYYTVAGKLTWSRNIYALATHPQFPYYFGYGVTTVYTPAAGDTFIHFQIIEADMVSDFAWGTASAQPVTLSFLVNSNLTGTFSGAIQNMAGNRSYPFTYSIPAASVWTKIVVTIPGDTAGTWVMSGNAGSIVLDFDLGSGATFRAPAGAWAASNYKGANGAVNLVANNSANWLVTGVKLEIGSVATPYNRQSLAKSMADCQRYYFSGNFRGAGYANTAGAFLAWSWAFPVTMRAAPTITPTFTLNSNVTSPAAGMVASDAMSMGGSTTASGNWQLGGAYTASAEL